MERVTETCPAELDWWLRREDGVPNRDVDDITKAGSFDRAWSFSWIWKFKPFPTVLNIKITYKPERKHTSPVNYGSRNVFIILKGSLISTPDIPLIFLICVNLKIRFYSQLSVYIQKNKNEKVLRTGEYLCASLVRTGARVGEASILRMRLGFTVARSKEEESAITSYR